GARECAEQVVEAAVLQKDHENMRDAIEIGEIGRRGMRRVRARNADCDDNRQATKEHIPVSRGDLKPACYGHSMTIFFDPTYSIRLSMPAAFQVSRFHLRPIQEVAAGSAQLDPAVDHDIAPMRELQGVERVLLHQEYGELLLGVELLDCAEDLPCDQWREAERRFVEQQKSRTPH